MLQLVDVGERSLDDYRGIAGDELLEALRSRAAGLRGAHREARELLRGYLTGFDAAVFTMQAFAPADSPVDETAAPRATHAGQRYALCSEDCRLRFVVSVRPNG